MNRAQAKAYERACDACRAWAASTTSETLAGATAERVAQSYGVKPEAAASIITNEKRRRST